MDLGSATTPPFYPLLSRVAARGVAALGVLVLAGWGLRLPLLTSLLPQYVTMKANAALCFVLLGTALGFFGAPQATVARRRIRQVLGAASAAIALATLLQYWTGRDLGIDQLLFADPAAPAGTYPGRMAQGSALALAFLGIATVILDLTTPRGVSFAQVLALVVGVVPLQALVAYLYGVGPGTLRLVRGNHIAVHAAVGLGALCAAVLAARADRGFMRVVVSSGPAGFTARRLLWVVLLLPVALGWLFLVAGIRSGAVEAPLGASFLVVSAIVVGGTLVWWNAAELERMDRVRRAAEQSLREVEAERAQLLASEQAARGHAERASRTKDEFIATLSHELRTPLNSVLGWARLLRIGKLDAAAQARAVEAIERAATTQAQIVDDLLDVSRIVRGELKLDVRPVELRTVIDAAVETVRPAAAARDIAIEVKLPKGTGAVPGDPGRLQQVMWNLLSNAIKFTPGGGRVEVRLEQEGSTARIQVADTGSGIAPDFLPHVFERFRQADSSATRQHGGLGLGLAIVRHLVEAHGGTVSAESPGLGWGATFTVSLPIPAVKTRSRVETEARAPHAGEGASAAAPADLRGVRVLVVDDDEDTLDVLRELLEQAGAEVTSAASAPAALQALESRPPDVLLSDIGMPGEDGCSLIRRVRALGSARGGDVPAAALTAYTQAERRQAAMEAGFEMYLAKPIDPGELTRAVARLASRGGEGAMDGSHLARRA